MTNTHDAVPRGGSRASVADDGGRGSRERCRWCGRELAPASGVGRRRRYCGQSCRQRAYEHRTAAERGDFPADAVVLTASQAADLADRLFQMRCAAEDVATAVAEGARRTELQPLLGDLLRAARAAERMR